MASIETASAEGAAQQPKGGGIVKGFRAAAAVCKERWFVLVAHELTYIPFDIGQRMSQGR